MVFVELEKEIENTLRSDISTALSTALRVAKRNCPVKTGRLRASIRRTSDTSIGTDVVYAQVQENRYGYLRAGNEAAVAYLRSIGIK